MRNILGKKKKRKLNVSNPFLAFKTKTTGMLVFIISPESTRMSDAVLHIHAFLLEPQYIVPSPNLVF